MGFSVKAATIEQQDGGGVAFRRVRGFLCPCQCVAKTGATQSLSTTMVSSKECQEPYWKWSELPPLVVRFSVSLPPTKSYILHAIVPLFCGLHLPMDSESLLSLPGVYVTVHAE